MLSATAAPLSLPRGVHVIPVHVAEVDGEFVVTSAADGGGGAHAIRVIG